MIDFISNNCLAKDSLILTKRGFVEIQNINIGDFVFTHKGNWKPVIAKKCTGVNEVVKVYAQGVPNLISTPTNKIWARKAIIENPEWIEAKDMKSSYLNLKLPPVKESDLSEKDWWVVGRYLANGWYKEGAKSFFICVNKEENEYFLKMIGKFATGYFDEKKHSYSYRLKKLPEKLKEMLYKCGFCSTNKQVPIECLCLNEKKSKKLLERMEKSLGKNDTDKKYETKNTLLESNDKMLKDSSELFNGIDKIINEKNETEE